MLFVFLQFLFLAAVPVVLFYLYERNAQKPRRAAAAATAAHVDAAAVTTAPPSSGSAPPPEDRASSKAAADVRAEEKRAARQAADSASTATTKTSSIPHNATATGAVVDGANRPKILIAYASNSQNALTLSHKLFNLINNQLLAQQQQQENGKVQTPDAGEASTSPEAAAQPLTPLVKILELREEDPHACNVDTLLERNQQSASFYSLIIFVVSTFTDGTAPPRSQNFEKVLKDCFEDHRVPRDALSTKRFALFSLGDVAYGERHFNAFGKHVVAHCRGLGAPHFVVPPVFATEAKVSSLFQVFSQTLLKWLTRAEFLPDGTVRVLKKGTTAGKEKAAGSSTASTCCQARHADDIHVNKSDKRASGGGDGECGCEAAAEGGDASEEEGDEEESGLDEIEDLIDDIETNEDDHVKAGGAAGSRRELLNPRLRKNLEKQGYNLIGSHSGVKLCRWTKAMLRGRGGCYKHTFYNINSSQCMELTPSLACANKCIFCWRHHTNPVSTTFRWKVDEPQTIVEGGIERHVKMINTMRGVPGVSEENLHKAFTVRHCALSLVGEPIMYPRINEFLHLLHTKSSPISSFMVTNAQFPEQLRMLRPVTQLYLSIDAPTADELKRIDRPLFEDYWERCLDCVDVLRKKRNTRTVFRLTLVNEMNNVNIAQYADLVDKGWPDFIEVKGVTFCGTSHTNTINMKTNVPRHDEVISFCARLCDEIAKRRPHYTTPAMNAAAAEWAAAQASGDGGRDEREREADSWFIIPAEERNRPYHIACEHEHSCCVLIALDKFYFDCRWNTWIDYPKFFELAAKYEEVYGLPPVLDDANGEGSGPGRHLPAAGGEEGESAGAGAVVPRSKTATAKKAASAEEDAATPAGRQDGNTAADDARADAEEGEGAPFSFTALDYCAPTPSWAVFRSAERGFDPAQTRVVRKNARPAAPMEA